MNRDWFARTQPETDGKLEVLREYPPMLYIDAHEFGLADYFFPPNADPEYHEIPDQAHDWINDLYSPAIVAEFNREGIKFFHGAPYDFFAIVFGDTVPATGFRRRRDDVREGGAATRSPTREHEHFTSMWASLAAGAAARSAGRSPTGTTRGSRPTRRASPGRSSRTRSSSRTTSCSSRSRTTTVRGYFFANDPDRQFELATARPAAAADGRRGPPAERSR